MSTHPAHIPLAVLLRDRAQGPRYLLHGRRGPAEEGGSRVRVALHVQVDCQIPHGHPLMLDSIGGCTNRRCHDHQDDEDNHHYHDDIYDDDDDDDRHHDDDLHHVLC